MSKFDQFHLRWRGQVTGPFAWTEIERKLDAHEIGLLHDLQQNNTWTSVGEYMASRAESVRVMAAVAPPPAATDFQSAVSKTPQPTSQRFPHPWVFMGIGGFFGLLGLFDIYARHWFRGAFLLALALLFFWVDWKIVWPWLRAVGEMILAKFDGKRRRMPWTRLKPPKPPAPPPPEIK